MRATASAFSVPELEIPADGPGAVDEQRDRLGALGRLEVVLARQPQRAELEHVLAVHTERLAARGEQAGVGTVGEDAVDELDRSRQHVLAVVEHQQPRALVQRLDHRVGAAVTSKRVGDRVRHGRVVVERGEHAPAHIIRVRRVRPGRDLGGEPCLPGPAQPGDGDQRLAPEQLA